MTVLHRLVTPTRTLEYAVARSSRRRSIGLKIDHRGLTVQLPQRAPLAEAERVLRLKLDWVLKHLDAQPAARPALVDGSSACWLGQPRVLRSGATRTRLSEQELHLPGSEVQLAAALARFLQRSARTYFSERVAVWSARMGLAPRALKLTSARTRWGSCTSAGDIRLNWRLLQAPPEVIDYVVIHELAHLAELNHSERFWAIVEAHSPAWRVHRDWLRREAAHFAV
ncbi:M48 family metallopeptidase [Chitinolyticbacter meiyuanensis]|uniref:M48 family metallopeptidase n=1 Tax=Chitinolyticbacter meiyuanensis TaxID=682798 RepID=UPI0011E5D922|nr:SprT family zinc-dependent metalloprotease [Chitinolyticbacter meiyuanensis]